MAIDEAISAGMGIIEKSTALIGTASVAGYQIVRWRNGRRRRHD